MSLKKDPLEGEQAAYKPRINAAYAILLSRYQRLETAEQRNGRVPITVGTDVKKQVTHLPQRIQELLKAVGITSPTVTVEFDHYRTYEWFKPSYEFSFTWARPEVPSDVIDSLHIQLNEDPKEGIIVDAFGLDSRTMYNSFAPFPY